MYLYSAVKSSSHGGAVQDAHTRSVSQELTTAYRARTEMRDPTSQKLNIKGQKAADQQMYLTMHTWRLQMEALPESIREHARMTYLLDKDVRFRDLQDFQMSMIKKLMEQLKEHMVETKQDVSKFRIGGHDRGTYERFFRVEPARYMTKPQFQTALRRAFGDGFIKSSAAMSKLYDSFDMDRLDQMDWRAFLFLLTIFMQPQDDCFLHLRWAFVIYASVGTLDFEGCSDKLSLSAIKDMLCCPALLCLRGEIRQRVDEAWIELAMDDWEAIRLSQAHGDKPMDTIYVSYSIYEKILTKTSFSHFLATGQSFGRMDPRPWLYFFELEYYHPAIIEGMKEMRRDNRDEEECRKFVAQVSKRIKRRHVEHWVAYVKRRVKVRRMLIVCSVRWRNDNCATFFDRWRDVCIINSCVKQIQRLIRGFNARRRRDFVKRIQKRAVRVQASVRQIRKRIVFNQYNIKRQWAATIIQKYVRARQARQRTVTRVEAKFDAGLRVIAKQRVIYFENRRQRAATVLQMKVRRFLVRVRVLRRIDEKIKIEMLYKKMNMEVEKGRIANEVYKKELEAWYVARKIENDLTRMNESNSKEQLKKVMEYRMRQKEAERLEKERRKEAIMEKQEEERIEKWIEAWEKKIADRVIAKGRQCTQCLMMPESPEDIILAKDLRVRIKAHVKVVLRRADKQKIPMEIPEAEELAKKEIIDLEMEAEREAAKEQMRQEATAGQAEIEAKKEREYEVEMKARKRKRKWAIAKIVSFWRFVVARKKLRNKAYLRYKKHFDMSSGTYYYEDLRSKKVFWFKPKSLDAYDITGDPGWVVMFDNLGDQYYYQPESWKMQWEQPYMSCLCVKCGRDFASVRMTDSKELLCEKDFALKVQEMLLTMQPQEICFKPFKGNMENSANAIFSYIPELTWWKYILSLDPALRESEEEREEQERLAMQKALRAKGIYGTPCPKCNNADASRTCEVCQTLFCDTCFDEQHQASPWDTHTWKIFENIKAKAAKAQIAKEAEKAGGGRGRGRGARGGPRGGRMGARGGGRGGGRSVSPSGGRGGGGGRGMGARSPSGSPARPTSSGSMGGRGRGRGGRSSSPRGGGRGRGASIPGASPSRPASGTGSPNGSPTRPTSSGSMGGRGRGRGGGRSPSPGRGAGRGRGGRGSSPSASPSRPTSSGSVGGGGGGRGRGGRTGRGSPRGGRGRGQRDGGREGDQAGGISEAVPEALPAIQDQVSDEAYNASPNDVAPASTGESGQVAEEDRGRSRSPKSIKRSSSASQDRSESANAVGGSRSPGGRGGGGRGGRGRGGDGRGRGRSPGPGGRMGGGGRGGPPPQSAASGGGGRGGGRGRGEGRSASPGGRGRGRGGGRERGGASRSPSPA